MSLADSLRDVSPALKGPRCVMCRIEASLSAADSAALTAALNSDEFTHEMILRALRAEGHDVRLGSVSRHRRGLCRGISRETD
jgi:hypothetical protein